MTNRDLFLAEDAEKFFASKTREPYRPSNGTEGEMFMERWCADCARDHAHREDPDAANGCEIIVMAMCHNITDPDYPKAWVWNEKGQPICTEFEEIGK